MIPQFSLRRRAVLAGGVAAVALPSAISWASAKGMDAVRAQAAPLGAVLLKPSIWANAVEANDRYLASLDPHRLLHNFYLSAKLTPPAPVYGGWEAQGIAGHSFGHWLSACSIAVAARPCTRLKASLDLALRELRRIQLAHGDGYIGGTTVMRDGMTIDGKIVFEEVRAGDVRSQGFDLNGGWVPLYTWHKVQAGLIDAHRLAGAPGALPILLDMAAYLAGVLDSLTDDQMQQVLHAEYGGLNESYADLYAITGNRRWLDLATRFYHKAVLDPLAQGRDELAGLHANTQIPKVIGLARLHEVADRPQDGTTARFFHERVTRHHSYVIGGNSDREHFGPADKLSTRITEATCEACNSYNMLKLTRQLYSWDPRGDWFDFYERVHLNHIMAHQRPSDGAFVYFMPLAAGARRIYSSPHDSFWCCVGTGMESHAKHSDSIYWSDGSTLFVNLFIPSRLDWRETGFALDLDTRFPKDGWVALTVRRAPRSSRTLALRLPAWSEGASISVNGAAARFDVQAGYARLTRRWREGDVVSVNFPMRITMEATPDDPSMVAFLHGPLVLAADLGSAEQPFSGLGPALVSDGSPLGQITATDQSGSFMIAQANGLPLTLRPFFSQYDRRTSVYFPVFSTTAWATSRAGYEEAERAQRDLAGRTVDSVYLGEMQPERDHAFASSRSEAVNWNGRSARKLEAGQSMTLRLRRPAGQAILRATWWGPSRDFTTRFSVEGTEIATQSIDKAQGNGFVTKDYSIPVGSEGWVTFEIQALRGTTVLYELRILRATGPTDPAGATDSMSDNS